MLVIENFLIWPRIDNEHNNNNNNGERIPIMDDDGDLPVSFDLDHSKDAIEYPFGGKQFIVDLENEKHLVESDDRNITNVDHIVFDLKNLNWKENFSQWELLGMDIDTAERDRDKKYRPRWVQKGSNNDRFLFDAKPNEKCRFLLKFLYRFKDPSNLNHFAVELINFYGDCVHFDRHSKLNYIIG